MQCPKCGSTRFAFAGFQGVKRITGFMGEQVWGEYFCNNCKTVTYSIYNFSHWENEDGEKIDMPKPEKKEKSESEKSELDKSPKK